ncbi:MAG TPA: WYL domain-containing protein, partial [Actinomycetota bacterium]
MHPLERLVDLVALLLDSARPLTFDEIRGRMEEAYGQEDVASAKRMFERDKDILRDVGVPVEVVATDVWEVEHGYVIPKEKYYLPEVNFTPEEISALFVAARSGAED